MIRPFLVILAALAAAAPFAAAAELEIVAGDIPPYTFEKDGKTRGVVAELVEALAKRVGHSGKLHFYPWKRALQLAEKPADGRPRLIVPLNRSPEREGRFAWVADLVDDETVIVTRAGAGAPVTDPKAALDRRIGVLAGSPLEAQLEALGFKRIDAGMDETVNAKKLALGRLDAWFAARLVAPFVYREAGHDPTELRYGASLDLNDLHLGGTKSLPEAEQKKWRDALAELKADGTYQRIVEAWLAPPKS